MNGCCRIDIKSYLDEFIWRHNKTVGRVDLFKWLNRNIKHSKYQIINQKTALQLEKNSFFRPAITNETSKLVVSVLADTTNNIILCQICLQKGIKKSCNGNVGLRIHTSGMLK